MAACPFIFLSSIYKKFSLSASLLMCGMLSHLFILAVFERIYSMLIYFNVFIPHSYMLFCKISDYLLYQLSNVINFALMFGFKISLCILDLSVLLDIWFPNMSSQYAAHLFILLMERCREQKLPILKKSYLLILSFLFVHFIFKDYSIHQTVHQRIPSMLFSMNFTVLCSLYI